GYLNIGIESFKTRCRKESDEWSQNVLVLDIGGGTTDVALIKLTLSDITPSFRDDKDRGLGGRYYQITPKLLGSSGHLQLGGELITLRMFRLLKVAIVDGLLSAIAAGELNNEKLNDIIEDFDKDFTQGGKYKPGSLLKCIDKERPDNGSNAYRVALETADKVLPTRWEDAPERLQTFYTLWDYAENAKLKLGQKPPQDGSVLTYTLSEQDISELLNQVNINIPSEQSVNLNVTLNRSQFERAAYLVIEEAVSIAKGLMESRLGSLNNSNDNSETKQEETETEKVDWLILSGKTCNLDLVKDQIYQQFSKSDYFLWNPERITFDPKFTKQGTSAGACYAEKMRRLKFSPEDAKPLLCKGANQLHIDVQNLFYYLPCNFKRKTQSDELLTIFKAGEELNQIYRNDEVVKVRTEWKGIQLANILYRQDYEGGELQLWGGFDGNELLEELKKYIPQITETSFQNDFKMQFEIDSALNIGILLCKGDPHYLVDGDGIDVNDISTENKEIFSQGKLQWDIYIERPNKQLKNGDIAVNVIESSAVDKQDAYYLLFEAVKENSENSENIKKFHRSSNPEEKPSNGLISKPLPDFREDGKHTLYICDIDINTNKKEWVRIGELSKPDVTTDFRCKYHVSLDEEGMLRIHAGEVPYLESEKKENLKDEGCVFRAELQLQPNEVDIERDPFSGTH
ncbi:MAG: molecular chaperone, partial [Cyanobacteria bacterium P01_A01_bin.84]